MARSAGTGKRPVLRFVLLFALLAGSFFAATMTPFAEQRAWPAYLDFNAWLSGAILRGLGESAIVSGRTIASPGGSLRIERGCDAVHPSGLFIAAVLAAPVSLSSKLPGLLLGTLALMVTNLVRIVSLYYVRIHFPSAFDVMHIEVWQAAFIFFAVMLWVGWAGWAVRRSPAVADASP